MLRRLSARTVLYALTLTVPLCSAWGQVWHSRAHELRRTIDTADVSPNVRVVQTELFLHGADPGSVVVYGRSRPVPFTILQSGPGDFLRIAFVPERNQARHWLYTSMATPDGTEAAAADTVPIEGGGLLVETRDFVGCDLNDFQSVREAFSRAERIGRRFVDQVFHRTNPCVPGRAPFFSLYRGVLSITRPGEYEFFTSSQDCSFLLIDGKIVASAPGRHGPTARARFGGKITLEQGEHGFEYWHAAAGTSACMVAAWKPPGAAKPELIPPAAFGAPARRDLATSRYEHRSGRDLPDFVVQHLGAVALPDEAGRLVRVRFEFTGNPGLLRSGSVRWEFGDGQSSQEPSPEHIYLRPGIYTVRLTVDPRGRAPLSVTSRVPIWSEPPDPGPPSERDTLEHYAEVVSRYDARGLDADALLVLARTLEYVENRERLVSMITEGLGATSDPLDGTRLFPLLDIVLPAARVWTGSPEKAVHLLRVAAERAADRADRARIQILLADVAINDLGQAELARRTLDSLATPPDQLSIEDQQRYWRVAGDIAARLGKGDEARAAYRKAAGLRLAGTAAAIARSGSYGRTIEGFLQEDQLELAALELIRWADEFPQCKLTGFWHLLKAQLHLKEQKPEQALLAVRDGLIVAPDSPYADQLVWLEAEAARQLGDLARARRALEQLVREYPGSPLVEKARQRVESLGQGQRSGNKTNRPPDEPSRHD